MKCGPCRSSHASRHLLFEAHILLQATGGRTPIFETETARKARWNPLFTRFSRCCKHGCSHGGHNATAGQASFSNMPELFAPSKPLSKRSAEHFSMHSGLQVDRCPHLGRMCSSATCTSRRVTAVRYVAEQRRSRSSVPEVPRSRLTETGSQPRTGFTSDAVAVRGSINSALDSPHSRKSQCPRHQSTRCLLWWTRSYDRP